MRKIESYFTIKHPTLGTINVDNEQTIGFLVQNDSSMTSDGSVKVQETTVYNMDDCKRMLALKKLSPDDIKNLDLQHEYDKFFDKQAVENTDPDILRIRELLLTPIQDSDFSVRAYNGLRARGMRILADVVKQSFEKFKSTRVGNFGSKSLAEVEHFLHKKGLSFGMDVSKYIN